MRANGGKAEWLGRHGRKAGGLPLHGQNATQIYSEVRNGLNAGTAGFLAFRKGLGDLVAPRGDRRT
jgi:hypothetical protein